MVLPIRIELVVLRIPGRTRIRVRASPWPHILAIPVYTRETSYDKAEPVDPGALASSAAAALTRLPHIAGVVSSSFSHHNRLVSLSWHSSVGTGDAASTAIACGALWAAKAAAVRFAMSRWGTPLTPPSFSVVPSFTRSAFASDFRCTADLVIASFLFSASFREHASALIRPSQAKLQNQ
ncbi:MAG: DUF2953 domain-containing protein [Clostridia bacterium]|nr:DUF2953 domain-containing protein [Clostridia bacterium]